MTTLEGLFAVVVNWNGGDDNLRCLASLVEDEGLPAERIVFVDNASVDGSTDRVRERFPGLVHVDHTENLGFGAGANAGARVALERGARTVAFVNNDVTFPGGTLAALDAALTRDPRLGLVGPRVLHADGPDRIWAAGGVQDHRQNLSTLVGHGQPDGPEWQVDRDVDYIVGCALAARDEVLEEVGLFEADYFAYHEDLELGLRARRAGWGVRTIGSVFARHAPSSATGGGYGARRKWMMGVNSVHFLRRHCGTREWLRFTLFDVLPLPLMVGVGVFTGRWRGALGKAFGIWDGLRGRRVTAERLAASRPPVW